MIVLYYPRIMTCIIFVSQMYKYGTIISLNRGKRNAIKPSLHALSGVLIYIIQLFAVK